MTNNVMKKRKHNEINDGTEAPAKTKRVENTKVEENGDDEPMDQTGHNQTGFSLEEFRDTLQKNPIGAMKSFMSQTPSITKKYIDSGGTLKEILRALDNMSIKPVEAIRLTFECFNSILLEHLANNQTNKSMKEAFEPSENIEDACQSLLTSQIKTIHSSLAPTSPGKLKKITLKLLTAFVTLSNDLAKEILLHVTLDATIVGDLSKNFHEKNENSIRACFIQFFLSFLIGGNVSNIRLLFDNKNILLPIVSRLIWDSSDTVRLVLLTFEKYLLKNPAMSKTMKLHIFNTDVCRYFVNLYNWKGKKSKNVGKIEKSERFLNEKREISEVIHQFLLTLCTSHKHGVVFTSTIDDPKQNQLMQTVIESLESPWGHKYVSDLIIQTVRACPDLYAIVIKSITANNQLKCPTDLSLKWLGLIDFVTRLIENLPADNLKRVNFKLFETYYAPRSILNVFNAFSLTHASGIVRLFALTLLRVILRGIFHVLSGRDDVELRKLLMSYLEKHLPSIDLIVTAWKMNETNDRVGNLNVDVFKRYDEENVDAVTIDVFLFYLNINHAFTDRLEMEITPGNVRVDVKNIGKLTDLFLKINPNAFMPTRAYFNDYMFTLINDTSGSNVKIVRKILEKLRVFENNATEMDVWLEYLPRTNDDFIRVFVTSVTQTFNDYETVLNQLNSVRKSDEKVDSTIFDAFEVMDLNVVTKQTSKIALKTKKLSPIIFKIADLLKSPDKKSDKKSPDKKSREMWSFLTRIYVDIFHMQTDPDIFLTIALDPERSLRFSKSIVKYWTSWFDKYPIPLRLENNCDDLTSLSEFLLGKSPVNFQITTPNESLIDLTVFYFTQLSQFDKVSVDVDRFTEAIWKIVEKSRGKFEIIARIFNNSTIYYYFLTSPLKVDENRVKLTSQLIVKLTKIICESAILTDSERLCLIKPYQVKIMNEINDLIRGTNVKTHDVLLEMLLTIGLLADVDVINKLIAQLTEITAGKLTILHENILICALKTFLRLQERLKLPELLDNETFDKIAAIYQTLIEKNRSDTVEMELIFVDFLTKYPHYSLSDQMYEIILKSFSTHADSDVNESLKSRVNLFKVMLNDSKRFGKFFSDDYKSVLGNKQIIFPIFNDFIRTASFDSDFLEQFLIAYEDFVWKYLTKPGKLTRFIRDNSQTVTFLISITNVKKRSDFLTKLKYDKFDLTHVELVEAVVGKPAIFQHIEQKRNYFEFLLENFNFTVKNNTDTEIIAQVNEKIDDFIESTVLDEHLRTKSFEKYVKNALRYGLSNEIDEKSRVNVKILTTFTKIAEKIAVEFQLIHEMIISHSDFLNIALDRNRLQIKTALFKLIHILTIKDAAVVTTNLFPIFLSAYTATLSPTDVIILEIIKLYESKTNLRQYRPYVWGDFAIKHYSVMNNRVETALFRQPTMKQIIDLLNPAIVLQTIENFDVNRSCVNAFYSHTAREMTGFEMKTATVKPKSGDKWTSVNVKIAHGHIYDPCFYLPLFNCILASESVVQSYKFTESGALSLTLLALSSKCAVVRKLACLVLARFYFHMEASRNIKEKTTWIQFIDAIRRGLNEIANDSTPESVSLISATFLARAALILTEPLNPLYLPITNFLFAKETFTFNNVPEFLSLFHSNDVASKTHRNWILNVIRDGIRGKMEINILLKSYTFKLIMDFWPCALADRHVRAMILEIFLKTLNVEEKVDVLVLKIGFVPWLLQCVQNLHVQSGNDNILNLILSILSKLLGSLVNLSIDIIPNSDKRLYYRHIFQLHCRILKKFPKDLSENMFLTFAESFARLVKLLPDACGMDDAILQMLDFAVNFNVNVYTCRYYLTFGVDQLIDHVRDVSIRFYLEMIVVSWMKLRRKKKIGK